MSVLETWSDSHNAIFSPESACGAMPCGRPDGPTHGVFGPDRAPASHLAQQGKGSERQTLVTSGLSGPLSSGSADLQSCLVSRLRMRFVTDGSTLFAMTWKTWVTPSGRLVFLLRASARRTSDSAFGSWPTPMGNSRESSPKRYPRGNANLAGTAALTGWPTPSANEFACSDRDALVARRARCRETAQNGNGFGLTLAQMLVLHAPRRVRLTATGEMLTGSCAGMGGGGQLNPAHSRWLMGLPPDWDVCAPMGMPSSRKSRLRS